MNQLAMFAESPVRSVWGFTDWYKLYPRHIGRAAAQRAYEKIILGGDATHDQLLEGARKFISQHQQTEKKYIPHPATWLNHHRWLDEYPDDPYQGGSYRDVLEEIR